MRVLASVALLAVLGAQAVHAQDNEEAPPAETVKPSVTEIFIADIYKTYTENQQGTPDEAGGDRLYSKRLQALFEKDAAETPEGEAGRLEFDPFVDGQDWEIDGLKVKEIYRSGGEAQVRAEFANFGKPRRILFVLVREDGAWRIDDIASMLPPRWTLSEILTRGPNANPNEAGE